MFFFDLVWHRETNAEHQDDKGLMLYRMIMIIMALRRMIMTMKFFILENKLNNELEVKLETINNTLFIERGSMILYYNSFKQCL